MGKPNSQKRGKTLSFELSQELYGWLVTKAESEHRSVSGQIRVLLEQARKHEEHEEMGDAD